MKLSELATMKMNWKIDKRKLAKRKAIDFCEKHECNNCDFYINQNGRLELRCPVEAAKDGSLSLNTLLKELQKKGRGND